MLERHTAKIRKQPREDDFQFTTFLKWFSLYNLHYNLETKVKTRRITKLTLRNQKMFLRQIHVITNFIDIHSNKQVMRYNNYAMNSLH